MTFEFLPLSKIIENYRKLSKITPEVIVIDKTNLLSKYQHYLETVKRYLSHGENAIWTTVKA
jgi:hypothetical protein